MKIENGRAPTHRHPFATTESGLREMGAGERTLRIVGGTLGAAGVAQGLGRASRTTSGASATVAEAVTPGSQTVRVRVPQGKTLEETLVAMNQPIGGIKVKGGKLILNAGGASSPLGLAAAKFHEIGNYPTSIVARATRA